MCWRPIYLVLCYQSVEVTLEFVSQNKTKPIVFFCLLEAFVCPLLLYYFVVGSNRIVVRFFAHPGLCKISYYRSQTGYQVISVIIYSCIVSSFTRQLGTSFMHSARHDLALFIVNYLTMISLYRIYVWIHLECVWCHYNDAVQKWVMRSSQEFEIQLYCQPTLSLLKVCLDLLQIPCMNDAQF